MRVSSNKLLQKYNHPPSHDVVTLLSAQNLSDSNFPEAALTACRRARLALIPSEAHASLEETAVGDQLFCLVRPHPCTFTRLVLA